MKNWKNNLLVLAVCTMLGTMTAVFSFPPQDTLLKVIGISTLFWAGMFMSAFKID